jgi:hypothetical protein
MCTCVRTPTDRRNRAFALVLALLLLSGVAMAVAGIGLLTRVELAVGAARDDAARARRKALVALDLALEHLQREAGPDARVTARADIVGGGAGDGGLVTGVWEARGGDSRLRTWLVSGNDAERPLDVGPEQVRREPGPGRLLLVGAGTVADPRRHLAVPLRPMRLPRALRVVGEGAAGPTAEGRYAYWIGDEGVKASLSLGAAAELPAADRRGWVSTSQGYLEIGDDWRVGAALVDRRVREAVLGPALETAFLTLPAAGDTLRSALRTRFERVLTHAQFPFVDPAIARAAARAHFETFTPLSRGVLVNLHDTPARLRTDLTSPSDPAAPALDGFLRTRPASDREGAFPAGRGPAGFVVAPVPTELLLRLGLRSDPASGRLALEVSIEVELWNPYAAPVVITGESGVALWVGGGPAVKIGVEGMEERYPSLLPSPLAFETGLRWEPGEVRILRGGRVLGPAGKPETVLTGLVDPGPTRGPVGVSTEEFLGAGRFGVALEAAGERQAGLVSALGFEAAHAAVGAPGAAASWLFAFGVEAKREKAIWSDGFRLDARDPRDASAGDLPVEESGSRWTRAPRSGPTAIPAAGEGFCEERRQPVFDLPVQEPHAMGYLQHAPLGRLRAVGNPWGGDANAWLDRGYLSGAPPGQAVAGRGANPFLGPRWRVTRETPSEFAADPTGAALRLFLNGAFNVHSTSEAAWDAVQDRAVYHRFPHSAADAGGRRALDAGERRALAREIVAALRRRGQPFGSLAAFASSGLVAGAIEAAGLNSTLPRSEAGQPGWLEQADVLGHLAPVLVPRSDTFLVRAGAEALRPGEDEVVGRAWCEALVQRLPELATDPGASPPTEAEQRMPDPERHPRGRRFRIVHFRWLSEADL